MPLSVPHPVEKSLAAFQVDPSPASSRASRAGSRRNPEKPGADSAQPTGREAERAADLEVVGSLAGWMDARHTLLVRTLLDRTDTIRLTGAAGVMRGTHRILDELRRETRLKFAEFREKWDARLEAKALIPFLTRNQWIEDYKPAEDGAPANGGMSPAEAPVSGVVLTGKGGRKEARMLYLQTAHDMATDCARQWASLAGRLQAFQTSFAAEWHAAVVAADDDATRLLPVLEAALRDAEFDAWKAMRLSLGDVAEEAFVRAAVKWETRVYPDAVALVHGTLPPWAGEGIAGNGFSGFMRALGALTERLSLAMLDHYERKWDLFLRGLPEPEVPERETRAFIDGAGNV